MQKIDEINKLLDKAWTEKYYDFEKARLNVHNAHLLSTEIFYERGEIYCKLYDNIFDFLLSKQNFGLLPNLLECLNYFENHKEEKGYPISLYFIGNVYDSFGDLYKGIDYCLKAIKYSQKIDFDEGYADALSTIGIIYSRIGDFKNSFESYQKSLEIREKNGDYKAVASTLNRIAYGYVSNNDFENAFEYYKKASELREKINDFGGLIWTNIGFANLYEKNNEPQKALEYYFKSLENNKKINDKRCELHCYKGLGQIYNQLNNLIKTKNYLEKAHEIATQLNAKPILYEIHLSFSEYYEKVRDFEKALFHFKEYQKIKESVFNSELHNKLKHQQISYEIENSKKETEIYYLRNVELKKAFDELEKKNLDITQSIEYARRIQIALLPPDNYFKELINECFILYCPRDIVSGDFYWLDKKDNNIIIVAADCTGHGVPGAFMSMLGIAFLNEIIFIRNYTQANEILNVLRQEIISSLRQTPGFGNSQDGMDISICIIDNKKMTMQFAGAYNDLCLIRDNEIKVFESDKMSVSISQYVDIPFKNNNINILKNDIFYIYSDGYYSQFGGTKDKKLGKKNMLSLFLEIHKQPLDEQQAYLNTYLKNWQAEVEQIDDVLIIGFKI